MDIPLDLPLKPLAAHADTPGNARQGERQSAMGELRPARAPVRFNILEQDGCPWGDRISSPNCVQL